MTDFTRMTPAERELWRMEKATEEERQFQAKMKRASDLQLLRTESFTKAKAERQLVSKTLLGHSKVLVEERGKTREATINGGIVEKPGIRGHFWGLELPNCSFPVLPEGIGRIRELFEAVGHPRDLAPFKEEGVLNCGRHYANHEFVLVFKGLRLADLGLEECVCVKGLHQYRNVSHAVLSSAPWRWPLGAEFDAPPGAEEDIEAYLKIGYVEDLKAPRKPKAQEEEKAKPKTPQEILKEAISDWEKDDD